MNFENKRVLEVKDLVVQYQVRKKKSFRKETVNAVNGVTLNILSGKTLALVGESGSGKSSIAKAILRLIQISSGQVVIDGQEVTKLRGKELRRARAKFQMIFQDPFESIDPRRTVMATIMESIHVANLGKNTADRKEIALNALRAVGLTPAERIANRYTHQLSGGQRQRVAIAAAMVLEPTLLIADEPVSMLDVSLRAGILKLMRELSQKLGVGTLFITHDLSLAWMYADEIAVLYLGKIVEQGLAEKVIGNPEHPYTKSLVSVIPSPQKNAKLERTVLVGESPDAANVPSGCAFHPRCPLYVSLGQPESCRTVEPKLVGEKHRVACHQIATRESR